MSLFTHECTYIFIKLQLELGDHRFVFQVSPQVTFNPL